MALKQLILSLLYPRRATCLGCGTMIGLDEDDLCDDCRFQLAQNKIGPVPVPKGMDMEGMAFAHFYRGPAGSMVRALKYSSVRILADRMCDDIAEAVKGLRIERIDYITFVPMHPKRERVRGFNQAQLLAEGLATRLGVPCEALLERTRNAKQQARLTKKERAANLKGVFRCERDLSGENVLLIDDVITTGATAGNCAEILREAGARQIYFAAFAASHIK